MRKLSLGLTVSETPVQLDGHNGGIMINQGLTEIEFNEDSTPISSCRYSTERYSLKERIAMVGINLDDAMKGEIIHVKSGEAWADFDPYGMNGFLLRAGALVAGGRVDIGFSARGDIIRATVNNRIVRGDDAMALWLMASRMK